MRDWADYVQRKARQVIEECGPRPPGSEGEAAGQRLVAEELRQWTSGEVAVEPFPVAQRAFMSVPRLTGILLAAAIAGYWISPWLAAGFSTLAAVVFAAELGLYLPLVDPLFPNRTSYNVAAREPPAGKIQRRLVLNAHTDAAYEWRLLHRFPRMFPWLVYCSIFSLAALFATNIGMLAARLSNYSWYEAAWPYVAILQVLCIPGVLVGMVYTAFEHVSPGANDNLSGVFAAVGLARYLRRSGIRLQQTELVLLITGSEEAGLRGAAAYAKRHRQEWKDVETIVITLETLRDLDHLHVYNRDMNGFVGHDPAVCRLLHDAGRRCGLELGYATVFLGSSDAAAFTCAGIRSAALCGMDPYPANYYHNRRDDWDNMSPACLRKACEVVLNAALWYDEHGLEPEDATSKSRR